MRISVDYLTASRQRSGQRRGVAKGRAIKPRPEASRPDLYDLALRSVRNILIGSRRYRKFVLVANRCQRAVLPEERMPRTDNEVRITPSVLDRLLDYEPEKSRESLQSRAKSLRDLKQCVKRDLEWLLNTRQSNTELPPDLKEVNSSVAAYGLPDFTAVGVKSTADQNRLRRAIEGALNTFEPRLEDVRVTVEPIQQGERVIHFRIDARLKVEPAPEPITFDTIMRPGSGECVVREE